MIGLRSRRRLSQIDETFLHTLDHWSKFPRGQNCIFVELVLRRRGDCFVHDSPPATKKWGDFMDRWSNLARACRQYLSNVKSTQ